MKLSDTGLRRLKPSAEKQKLSDGGGLQLWVLPGGAKTWRYAYRFNGKQKGVVLGQEHDGKSRPQLPFLTRTDSANSRV